MQVHMNELSKKDHEAWGNDLEITFSRFLSKHNFRMMMMMMMMLMMMMMMMMMEGVLVRDM